MDTTMKHAYKRRMKRTIKAGITTYVIIMFGMSMVMYMFGYTNMWTSYSNQAIIQQNHTNITSITNPQNTDIIKSILSQLANPLNLILFGAGLLSIVVAAIGIISKNGSLVIMVIPIIWLIVFINIFIFPISDINSDSAIAFANIPELGLQAFLIAFFNLFMLLSIFEYITGRPG